ncbi:MAG: hypothetical protein AVDCRST_MAG93-88 [uncultured Chloroflexia bacterium]|uniref:Uncharacterized protein n=1 Tax=uncultured Chloroflexia bacterium TaxID=1672391 RepID=A0A6J4H1P8_9CHLR|nr:MAG: hypothetical protein AVDCRST_MAG93-88 [uncultured Chloroflexia bacterium]
MVPALGQLYEGAQDLNLVPGRGEIAQRSDLT